MSDSNNETGAAKAAPLFDFSRSLALIGGGLTNAEATWRDYLPTADNWQTTALLLTIPLVLLGALGAYIIGALGFGSSWMFAVRPTLVSTLFSIVTSLAAAAVVAFVFGALAGVMGGKNHFGLALAATTFAFIPGYFAQAIMWLPWAGGLLALILGIYGLVLLWKILPIYLEVPSAKHAAHYFLSLVLSIIAFLILTMLVGRTFMPSMGSPSFSGISDSGRTPASSTVFGGLARQGELLNAAEDDRYEPPSDGELKRSQVREFVRVMERTMALQQEKAAELQELARKAENNEQVSMRDLTAMMGGAAEVAGLRTTEIEVVKSSGGNWAEHEWVRESLRTARVQQSGNATIEHNYALYQDYEDELQGYLSW